MNVESSSWCAQLITRQRSGACVAPFTSIPRSAHFKFSSDLKSVILNLGGLNTSTPNWMSAQGQDWWVWYNHARFMRRKGIYVDLAANDPIWRSNTFFFDVCMGWSGLCIEPSKMHHKLIRERRSCKLIPTCISDKENRSVKFNDGAGWNGGASAVLTPGDTSPQQKLKGEVKKINCKTLKNVVDQQNVRHIDFLSLDVEGHEQAVVSGFNFSETTVDIVISENPAIRAHLRAFGYRELNASRHFGDTIFLRNGFVPLIEKVRGHVMDWKDMKRCNNKRCDPRSSSCWWGE